MPFSLSPFIFATPLCFRHYDIIFADADTAASAITPPFSPYAAF